MTAVADAAPRSALLAELQSHFGEASTRDRLDVVDLTLTRLQFSEAKMRDVYGALMSAMYLASDRRFLQRFGRERDARAGQLREALQSFRRWYVDDMSVWDGDEVVTALDDLRATLDRLMADAVLRAWIPVRELQRRGRPAKPDLPSAHEALERVGVAKKADRIELLAAVGVIESRD